MFPLRPLEPEQINLTSKLIRFIITAARLKKLKSANMKKTFPYQIGKHGCLLLTKKKISYRYLEGECSLP